MSAGSDAEESFLRQITLSPSFKTISLHSGHHSTPFTVDHRHKRESRHHKKHKRRHSDSDSDGSPVRKSSHRSLDTSQEDLLHAYDYLNSPTTTPSGRDNKAGWYDIHDKHVCISKSSKTEVVLIGDSIVAGLSRYPKVWRLYFGPYQAVNLGIGGDRTQHVLWRAKNIDLPNSSQYLIVHCGTNNIDRDSPKDIANGIMSIGLVCQEKRPWLKVIVTGLLPRDMDESFRRGKIQLVNRYLKQFCCSGKLSNFYYMSQDKDWTCDDGTLNGAFYYTDYLHLIEAGNEKFAKSIVRIIEKLEKSEDVEYSDDNNDAADLSQKEFNDDDYHATKRSLSYRTHHYHRDSRRHHRSRESRHDSSRKESRKRRHSPDVSNESLSPYKWSKARKWGQIIKKEHHKHYQKLDTSPSPSNNSNNSSEEVKSIDISLDDADRRKARLAKFSLTSSAIVKNLHQMSSQAKNKVLNKEVEQPANESEIVKRIRRTSTEARKQLEHQKRFQSAINMQYHSPTNSSQDGDDDNSTATADSIADTMSAKEKNEDEVAHKFFTDYTADSDSE